MNTNLAVIAVLLAISPLGDAFHGTPPLPDGIKQSFAQGVERMTEQKTAIFTKENLPAISLAKGIQITSDLKQTSPDGLIIGMVNATIPQEGKSVHVQGFHFSYRDGKWTLAEYTESATDLGVPPKCEVSEPLTRAIPKMVQACFEHN